MLSRISLTRIPLILSLLLIVGLLAACGGTTEPDSGQVVETPALTPGTQEAAPPDDAADAATPEAEAEAEAPAEAAPVAGRPVFEIVMSGALEGEGGYDDQGFGRRPEYLEIRSDEYRFRVRVPFEAEGFRSARLEADFHLSTAIESGTYPLSSDASVADGTEAVFVDFGSANPNDPRFDFGEGEITVTIADNTLSAQFNFTASRRNEPETVVEVSGQVADLPIPAE